MINQTTQSFSVFYDIDRNKYYRINKLNGQTQPSSKTGTLPAKFDPQVTGTNYVARRNKIAFNTLDSRYAHEMQNQNTQSLSSARQSTTVDYITQVTQPLKARNPLKRHQQQSDGIKRKNKPKKPNQNTSKQSNYEHNASLFPTIKNSNSPSPSPSLLHNKNYNSLNDSPILHTIRNSKANAGSSPISQKNKENNRQYSFFNSMKKLNLTSAEDSISHTRIAQQSFANKLNWFTEIQHMKLRENNFQLADSDQKTLRLRKIAESSFSHPITNQSSLASNKPSGRLGTNLLNLDQPSKEKITKTEVSQQLNMLSKQKASLLLLVNKNKKQTGPFTLSKKKTSSSKLLQSNFKPLDLQVQKQKQNIKQQLSKQKASFLSFYPQHNFKQNQRLIQEQRDRKINLKNLQRLFLENNRKKFAEIYISQSIDSQQPKL